MICLTNNYYHSFKNQSSIDDLYGLVLSFESNTHWTILEFPKPTIEPWFCKNQTVQSPLHLLPFSFWQNVAQIAFNAHYASPTSRPTNQLSPHKWMRLLKPFFIFLCFRCGITRMNILKKNYIYNYMRRA